MDFVLRPGERITRYYRPESESDFYLPYHFDGGKWQEFPSENAQYRIRTRDGPRSQKDARVWGTGRIEYRPPLWNPKAYYPEARKPYNDNMRIPAAGTSTPLLRREAAGLPGCASFELRSPWVLIDAKVSLNAALAGPQQLLEVDISTDEGRRWQTVGSRHGPFAGDWEVAPEPTARSAHGTLTAVAGRYSYLVRIRISGRGPADSAEVSDVRITSRFQLNPRTLPELRPGRNELVYRPGAAEFRREIVPAVERLADFAREQRHLRCVTESGQSFLWPKAPGEGWVVFELKALDDADLAGFDAGARFLDLREGLAPDKLTAEVRRTPFPPASGAAAPRPRAELSWSTSPEGPFRLLWAYDPDPAWKDGQPVAQLLRWPEVDRSVSNLPKETRRVYVRYSVSEMGLDSLRLATTSRGSSAPSALDIIHRWSSGGVMREHVERVEDSRLARSYVVDTGSAAGLRDHAVILYCPPASADGKGSR
jgi:hypothetical protein